jgi:hypothetical protein
MVTHNKPRRWESVQLVGKIFRHTQKGGWYNFFYIKNTQKTILKMRLYELICSAFSQPLFGSYKKYVFFYREIHQLCL